MALYPDYDRDEIFKAIGKSIARFNELQVQIDDLEDIVEEQIPLLNESVSARDFLGDVMDTREANKDRLEAARDDCVANVTTYITTGVAEMLDVVTEGADDVVALVLDALEDAMYIDDDKVACNVIPPPELPPPGAPDLRADIDNAGVGALNPYGFHEQQTHDDLDFDIECFDASTPGSERWTVVNNKEDNLGILTTGVTFELKKYGISFLLNRITAIEEAGDGAAQLSNWVLTGAIKRTGDQESADSLAKGNSDFWGVYHVKLYDVAGTRHVELYQDAARTILVASGSRVGDGTIVLAAAGLSGLTGSVDVAYTIDDPSITVRYPFPFAAGDKYYYKSEVATPKLFQTFFVEEYDRALPCGTPITVLEVWAMWTP
jgi:hypothetical protein